MHDRPHWYQWPTILSLDAPAVSLVWEAALARVAGVHLNGAQRAVLALTVWLAYVADRWIEGWRLHPPDIRTARHHFYMRWRWPVAAAWVIALVIDIAIAFRALAWHDIVAGSLLCIPVLLYLLSHQLIHRHYAWRAPKELCVAALLTGGVCVFLETSTRLGVLALSESLFALLCFTNCALISAWEREVDLAHGQSSLAIDAVEHSWAIPQLPWLIVILSVVAYVGGVGPSRVVAGCAMASAVLLAMVDRLERRAGWMLARVLADVALLTPALPLLWKW